MHNEKIILSNLNQELNKVVSELQNAFLEIQQPRTEFTLRHFVVGQHDTIEQQYAQCVLEMQIKYDNIRRALLSKKRIEIEIKELESKNTEIDLIDAEIKKIDLEAQDRAIVGAWREFQVLYKIWNEFPKKYTASPPLCCGSKNRSRKCFNGFFSSRDAASALPFKTSM